MKGWKKIATAPHTLKNVAKELQRQSKDLPGQFADRDRRTVCWCSMCKDCGHYVLAVKAG